VFSLQHADLVLRLLLAAFDRPSFEYSRIDGRRQPNGLRANLAKNVGFRHRKRLAHAIGTEPLPATLEKADNVPSCDLPSSLVIEKLLAAEQD
jgi:hypothetical protein